MAAAGEREGRRKGGIEMRSWEGRGIEGTEERGREEKEMEEEERREKREKSQFSMTTKGHRSLF